MAIAASPSYQRTAIPADVRFNLSHSHGRVLYAVTLGTEVGVDLEHISPRIDAEGISRRFFSAQEQQALLRLPHHQRHGAFFRFWTCKEACIKAMGGTIAMDLSQVDVAIALDQPQVFVDIRAEDGQSGRWWVFDLTPHAKYRGALAIASPPQTIQSWQWCPELGL